LWFSILAIPGTLAFLLPALLPQHWHQADDSLSQTTSYLAGHGFQSASSFHVVRGGHAVFMVVGNTCQL